MSTVYEIGPFRLEAATGVLTHAGVAVALGSRAVAVLTALVAQSNECVPKHRIIDAAWPGVVVEEGNLAVQISAIRRVLASVAGGEHWIQTLPRRGYRFVGPVREHGESRRQAMADARRSNLPPPMTSFVGRERELIEIKRLLPGKRLLTLVGVGGIGKTRLALQLGAEVMDAYRDGVWLLSLGSITGPSLVPASLAQVLGIQEQAGVPLMQTLCSQLRARQFLLLVDNCEHLLDACASLVETLLRGVAEATIVATSREPLHIGGEQVYVLPTLSLPDPSANVEIIVHSEAAQLFVERARLQQPSFELTERQAPALAQLCARLDGIPLALELAAARIRSLSIEQINARLDDRFRLLTSTTRAALPHQQTLRATFDWSYDLLVEQERIVLRRLAAFPGSFTLEAASAVVGDKATDQQAVLEVLSQLVSRSLVAADTRDPGARYRLLETTRAYALEKLVEADETDIVKRRHAQFFRELFARAADDSLRMSDADWDATYLPELANTRAAIDWALGPGGDAAIGVGLAAASGPIWIELSLRSEGRQRLEAALAHVEPHTPQPDQAGLWRWLSMPWGSTPTQALSAYERASELYRQAGDVAGAGLALVLLGAKLARMGRCDEAARRLAQAFELLERVGAPKLLAQYFLEYGVLKALTGDPRAARLHYEKALALCRSANAERTELTVLMYLAEVTWTEGELDAALARFRETVALARRPSLASSLKLGFCLTNLAGVHTERGELDAALAAAREGLPLRKEAGYAWATLDHLALRSALAGQVANAARLAGYADSVHAAKESSRQPNEARAREHVRTLLRDKLPADELQRLLADGGNMSEDEACAVALDY